MDSKDKRVALQQLFDELWKAYPLHQDYQGAFTIFLDLVEQGVDTEMLLSKAGSYSANVDPNNLKYVPHLKSWLRNRRFDDEDLFTDEKVSTREFFVRAWKEGNVGVVQTKYGFIYPDPPIPADVTDVSAYRKDDRVRWVGAIANHVLNSAPLPE